MTLIRIIEHYKSLTPSLTCHVVGRLLRKLKVTLRALVIWGKGQLSLHVLDRIPSITNI